MHERARSDASDEQVVHSAVESRVPDAQIRNKCVGRSRLDATLGRVAVVEVTVREVDLFNHGAEIDGKSRGENHLAVVFHLARAVAGAVVQRQEAMFH